MIKVSIVVPVYNVSQYLEKCLSSICGQAYTNIEIILVDDGSTDDSPRICDEYALDDNKIIVIHQANCGVVTARNKGIEIASGEYVTFVDADDWIDPDHISDLLKSLHGSSPDMGIALSLYRNYSDGSVSTVEPSLACHLEERIYDQSEFEKYVWPEFINDNDILAFNVSPNIYIRIYKTEFIKKNIYEIDNNITVAEDSLLNFICLINAKSLGITYKSGYHYNIHNNSAVHSVEYRRNVYSLDLAQNNLCNYLEDKIDIDKNKKLYYLKKWNRITYYSLMVSAPEYFSSLSNDFLFPYQEIVNGSRILVYGLGGYGAGLVRYILSNNRFVLTGISDRQIKVSGNRKYRGIVIHEYTPRDILKCEFDYIVITTSRRNITDSIKENLIKMGVAPSKIANMDQQLFDVPVTFD